MQRIAWPLLKMRFNSSILMPVQSQIPSQRPNETLPTKQRTPSSQKQSNARHPPRNGQTLRRPIEPPGLHTIVCLDFVWVTILQLGGQAGYLSGWSLIFWSLRGSKKETHGERRSSSLKSLCRWKVEPVGPESILFAEQPSSCFS